MSLGSMMGGALDIHALVEQLKSSGGNVIVINPGAGGAPGPDMMGGPPPMPPAPPAHESAMISNGAPPALGPDIEGPAEDAAEGGKEEPGDMLGAVKAGLSKMPKKGPPKAPSKGVGKGPAKPQTKPGSAKLPAKKADTKLKKGK